MILLNYKTVAVKHNFQTKKITIKYLAIKVFAMNIFATTNSKNRVETLRIVTIEKPELTFLLPI